ncbi:hypothetical protein vseg_001332 [Gypsophila vaccaria]
MNQNLTKKLDKDENFPQNQDLPDDLIAYSIIIRLPIKSLLQLKLLSKQCYSTLSSPHFGLSHFNFTFTKSCIRRSDVSNGFECTERDHLKVTPLDPTLSFTSSTTTNHLFVQCGNDYFIYTYVDDVEEGMFKLDMGLENFPKDSDFVVVGSCNGLVCLYCSWGNLVVCNPVVKNWVKISCEFLECGEESVCSWGFGFVSSLGDYRIVRMSESRRNPSGIIVHLYSLGSREWKQVYDGKVKGYVLKGGSLSGGVLVNETLYWIMHQRGGDYDEQDILGFDLARETFVQVVGLVPGDSYLGGVRFVCCMGGCLGMGRFTNRGDVSVSILKESGQVEYIGLYRDLGLGWCCSAVGFTGDGKFFVQLGERELGIVDPSCSPKRYTRLFNFNGKGFIDVKGFVPSLVSPSAIAEM